MKLEKFQGGRTNLGLAGERKISLGTDWFEVLVVRDLPATG